MAIENVLQLLRAEKRRRKEKGITVNSESPRVAEDRPESANFYAICGTYTAREKTPTCKSSRIKWIKLVDGMGFEPTTPALRTPCSPS